MYSSDGFEAETLEELAKEIGEHHFNKGWWGSPSIKYIFTPNNAQLSRSEVMDVEELALEHAMRLQKADKSWNEYEKQCRAPGKLI